MTSKKNKRGSSQSLQKFETFAKVYPLDGKQCIKELNGDTAMGKRAYIILIPIVVAFLIGVIVGIVSVFPGSIIGLLITIGLGLLFIKVLVSSPNSLT